MLSSAATDMFSSPFRRCRSFIDPFETTECPWDDEEDTVIDLVPAGAVVARAIEPVITLPPLSWEPSK